MPDNGEGTTRGEGASPRGLHSGGPDAERRVAGGPAMDGSVSGTPDGGGPSGHVGHGRVGGEPKKSSRPHLRSTPDRVGRERPQHGPRGRTPPPQRAEGPGCAEACRPVWSQSGHNPASPRRSGAGGPLPSGPRRGGPSGQGTRPPGPRAWPRAGASDLSYGRSTDLPGLLHAAASLRRDPHQEVCSRSPEESAARQEAPEPQEEPLFHQGLVHQEQGAQAGLQPVLPTPAQVAFPSTPTPDVRRQPDNGAGGRGSPSRCMEPFGT